MACRQLIFGQHNAGQHNEAGVHDMMQLALKAKLNICLGVSQVGKCLGMLITSAYVKKLSCVSVMN
jgi:hypothetical protein